METILIGSDHGGFELKEEIRRYLDELGCKYKDYGCDSTKPVDYPDIAMKLAKDAAKKNMRGILICGTGIGMAMTANKIKGIRAAVCHDEFTARMSREHNNANVLCMGGRVLNVKTAKMITKIWLETAFTKEDRHVRRINKIKKLEC
jgi:ribose 5-phosphate isomerase B